jgi:hypothetical protein
MRTQTERIGITQTALHILPRMVRSTVDFRFVVDKDVSIRIVVRPGLWLKHEKLQKLLDDLQQVISETIPLGLNYGVVSGDKWCLDHAAISILYDRTNHRPIGFNAFCLLEINLREQPIELLHLGLVVVDPRYQASGYSWVLCGLPCLLIFLRNGGRSIWISSVSQVPAALALVAKGFDNVFPSLKPGQHRSFDHLSIAKEIMNNYRHVFGVGADAEFDESAFIIRNAYNGGSQNLKKSFESSARSSDEYINAWCRTNLDYSRGDDVLQIGNMNYSVATNYLLRTVPKESILYLLYRLSFVVFGSVLFFTIQWLSASKTFGEIRPRGRRA